MDGRALQESAAASAVGDDDDDVSELSSDRDCSSKSRRGPVIRPPSSRPFSQRSVPVPESSAEGLPPSAASGRPTANRCAAVLLLLHWW
ncbi:hypothetical protein Q1695_010181 [Nippostrongylus brasiliensis]|nr:hypothetical protein Q1695_010181 [Nippostrongylus brasiliensis]